MLSLLLYVLIAGGPVMAQAGRFDLEKTKTVLSGMIEKALQTQGVPSISIALVKDDAIVWKAAFGQNGAGVVDGMILDSSGQTMPLQKRTAAAGGGGVRH